jgi:hypothetical protein
VDDAEKLVRDRYCRFCPFVLPIARSVGAASASSSLLMSPRVNSSITVVKTSVVCSAILSACIWIAVNGTDPLNKETTLRKRLVISSAIITAQWSYCGYRFRSMSQYSMVQTMCVSSVAPSCTSTSYRRLVSGSCKRRSRRPARGWALSLSRKTKSPMPRMEGSSAIRSWTHRSFSSGCDLRVSRAGLK